MNAPKLKFRRIYSGPGYPIDPKLEDLRTCDAFVNSVADMRHELLPPRTYCHEAMNRWLMNQLN